MSACGVNRSPKFLCFQTLGKLVLLLRENASEMIGEPGMKLARGTV